METRQELKFIIVHRYAETPGLCLPTEEVLGIWLAIGDVLIQLALPLGERLLLDHLAHHRWVAQNSAQIMNSMRTDPFYVRHAAKAHAGKAQTRRFTRGSVRVYVARLRQAIQLALDAAQSDLRADSILRSEPSIGNEVRYRFHGRVEWRHLTGAGEHPRLSLVEILGTAS